jgi:hypothetical protein
VLQGFFGFVLGVILTVVTLAYQPQLIGDVQQGLNDLGSGASRLADRDDPNDVALSLTRRFASDDPATHDERSYDDHGGNAADQYADRRDDSYRRDSYQSAIDRNSSDRFGDRNDGSSRTCRGSIALENHSGHSVEVHLRGQNDGAVAASEGDETVDLQPGERADRDVRAQGDCDRLNAPGGLTVEAEICPLNGPQHAGTCHTENLPVDSGPSDTAESRPERQAAGDPRG